MKKKKLFYSLIASSLFVSFLTSCDDTNVTNNNQNSTNNSSAETTNNVITTETEINNLANNDLSRKVFDEYLVSFPNASYADFLLNGTKSELTIIRFYYKDSHFELDLDGNFISKSIVTRDNDGKRSSFTYSKYINNEWIIIQDSIYINGEQCDIYSLNLNDDNTFSEKTERSYDDLGNGLSWKYYKYLNNEWIKTSESISINNERKLTYYLTLKDDNSFDEKTETTYDTNGNKSTQIKHKYINNEWIKIEESKSFNKSFNTIYYVGLSSGNLYSKREMTFDDNGNKLNETVYSHINNEWIKSREYIYINNQEKIIYKLELTESNEFDIKSEAEYDSNGNKLKETKYKYINNEWIKTKDIILINGEEKIIYILNFKDDNTFDNIKEYTYDESGKELTEIIHKYVNNSWIKTEESKYINYLKKEIYAIWFNKDGSIESKHENTYDASGNKLTYVVSKYENNEYTYDYKYDYTYDKNNNRITRIKKKYIDGSWIYDLEYEYEYNINGTISKETNITYKNGVYSTKKEYINDADGILLNTIESEYINNDWLKMKETISINNVENDLYVLKLNLDNTFRNKREYTYDASGNKLSSKYYEYINDSWVLLEESKGFNNELKIIYEIYLDLDNLFDTKYEYTYDEFGNELTRVSYKYLNNEWIKYNEQKYINNVLKTIYSLDLQDDKIIGKEEYTYDDTGIELTDTYYKYINNDWLKTRVYEYINKDHKLTYYLTLHPDNSINCITTYIYDSYGRRINKIDSHYNAENWLYDEKEEYEYENNTSEKPSIMYYCNKYDNSWEYINKYEYTYNDNGMVITELVSKYEKNLWVYDYKYDYTYDENGNRIKSTYSQYVGGIWITRVS